MTVPSREQLFVYWDGEEVAGFIVFALRQSSSEVAPFTLNFGWLVEPLQRASLMVGDAWEVATWDIQVLAWPQADDFLHSISAVLAALIDGGWSVAWIGVEGSFVDPPQLFSPDAMPGGVLAACSTSTGFISNIDLDAALMPLTNSQMFALVEASDGLAASN